MPRRSKAGLQSEPKMTNRASNLNPDQDYIRIRRLEPHDRSPIERMVISSGKFNDVEIATALELVEEALEEGEESGYIFAVLEHGRDPGRGYRAMPAMARCRRR